MTQDQATKLLLTLKTAFPREEAFLDPMIAEARERLYSAKFQSLVATSMAAAVDAWIMRGTRYPTLGDLMAEYAETNRPRPELERYSGPEMLPAEGETTACAEEVQAAVHSVVEKLRAPEATRNGRGREKADTESVAQRKRAEAELVGIKGKLEVPR